MEAQVSGIPLFCSLTENIGISKVVHETQMAPYHDTLTEYLEGFLQGIVEPLQIIRKS